MVARLVQRLAPVFVAGLLVVGCGGDDGGGGSNDTDPGRAPSAKEQDSAYEAGRISCGEDGVEKLARALGVEATPGAVADAYARKVSTPDFQDASRDGCLAGLGE